jgi:hypothetical protein
MAKGEELAKAAPTSIQASRPDYLKEFDGQEVRGLEQVTSAEMVLPRLALCQNTSPQRDRTNPKYIPGLQEGTFFNSLTKGIYGEKLTVMPLFFRKSRIYWKDINEGGGIICRAPHGNDCQLNDGKACLHSAWGKDGTPPLCTEFYNYACLIYPTNEPIVVSLKVTGIKAGKEWNSMMRLRGSDPFSGLYDVMAVPARNATGQTYYTYQIVNSPEEGGWVTKDQFVYNEKQYVVLSKQLDEGDVKVDESTLSEEAFAMRDASEM